MIIELSVVAAALIVGGSSGYLISKKIAKNNEDVLLAGARAKAKAIEHEAEIALKNSNLKAKELEIGAKKRFDDDYTKMKREYESKLEKLEEKDNALNELFKDELKSITLEKDEIKQEKKELKSKKDDIESLKQEYQAKLEESLQILQKSAGLTEKEAKEIVLKKVEENSRNDIAHIVRKYEIKAKEEAKRKANYILAQATTRFAGEFAAERLINVVTIPDDELKGRIIGKEGRNIKALEMLLGVDIIIDDTPNAIILSSFNLYRRAIATKVIALLVEDGRIQPARIEDIYAKVQEDFDNDLLEEGENIIMDLGLSKVHPEIVKLIGRLKFRASYGQNALAHSLEVAHLSGIIAAECGGDEKLAKRAGILHDIGKALTHEFAGSHVDLGAELCKRYKEDPVVINAIYAHHGHEEATTVESAAVCTADTLSAARPGARREVLEAFLKRVSEIEEIAKAKTGIKQAYAINAGREVRVIANANLINDDEAVLLAKEIATEIEEKVKYPGDIKVNVIRESRAIDFAR